MSSRCKKTNFFTGFTPEPQLYSLRIQSECWKMQTRISPDMDTFQAVLIMWQLPMMVLIWNSFFSFSTINHITISSVSPSPPQTSMIKMDGISFRHRVYVYDWDIGLLTIVPKSSPWLDSEPSFRVCWSCFDYICCSSRRCKYHCEL